MIVRIRHPTKYFGDNFIILFDNLFIFLAKLLFEKYLDNNEAIACIIVSGQNDVKNKNDKKDRINSM